MSLMSLTALELGRRIQTREVSAVEAVRDALCRISKVEKNLNCFVTVDEEGALLRAQKADEKIQRGELVSPLAGVPVAMKDNLCTKGIKTTCSSKILENFTRLIQRKRFAIWSRQEP